jgi:thiamine transport system ATP-binding protein
MLAIAGLSAGYDAGPDVLREIALDVRPGEIVALLGPSGSGKSTLLRCVAGLHPLRAGRITIDGTDVAGMAVERRRTGLVFQDHALFPHRDVTGNVGFGPRMQGVADEEVERRVVVALESVGLLHLRTRAVDELSGGEQQRVALARAVASEPRLLLLDEPYGSLDRPLRERMLAELPALVRTLGAAALLVTHDQEDALTVADRIAVLIDGQLRQFDAPEVLWQRPADVEVARFLEVGPMLDGEARDGIGTTALGALPAPGVADGPVTLLLPHAAVRLDPGPELRERGGRAEDGTGVQVRLPGQVLTARFAGDHERLSVRLAGGVVVRLRQPVSGSRSADAAAAGSPRSLAVGAPVDVVLSPGELRWFPRRPAEDDGPGVGETDRQ